MIGLPTRRKAGKRNETKPKKKSKTRRAKEKGKTVRCNKVVITLHDSFDILELQLVIAVQLLNGRSILVPVVGSAGAKDGRRGGRGRRDRQGGRRRDGTFHHEQITETSPSLILQRLPEEIRLSKARRLGAERSQG